MGEVGKRSPWVLAAIIVGPIVLAGGCIAAFSVRGDRDYSPAEIAEAVVKVCHEDVRNSLRDPDSAQFTQWKAWEVGSSTMPHGPDGEVYSAAGLVNAKNGFGGYVGNTPYTCDAVVSKDGNVRARAIDASDVLETP
jgi:hypothetical protein